MSEFGVRQVGEFYSNDNRQRFRAIKNPIDKSTIVSIYPVDIHEIKHSIEPGVFEIPAGSYEKPTSLVVGSSSWWKDIDLEQPMLEIPVSSVQVANAVIRDYCNGMLGCNMGDAMPGMFFILGEVDPKKIKTEFAAKLLEVKVKQENWFRNLVQAADVLWSRSNGNPLSIWNLMRIAAKELNLNDKPWLKDYQVAELVKCFACGGLRNPEFPICPQCKTIDQTHPKAKELKFAV